MCEDDLIICYVGRLGIDHVARVVKRSNERPAPWPGSDHKNETAYVANVKYFTIKPTIKKEEYMDKMLNYGYYKYSPFSSVGTINQGYAFELDDVRFNFLTGLRNLSQSDFMI